MNREDLDKMNAEIEEVRQKKVDAMEMAIRHRGWRRWVFLRFARFFDWATRFGEKVRDKEMRGD